jgi:hypothetical protein
LKGNGAIEVLFGRSDAALSAAGFLAMQGQIIDATIIAGRHRRSGRTARKNWCWRRRGSLELDRWRRRNPMLDGRCELRLAFPKKPWITLAVIVW